MKSKKLIVNDVKGLSGYIREHELLQRFSMGRAKLRQLIREGKFAQPLTVSLKITVWDEVEVRECLAKLQEVK